MKTSRWTFTSGEMRAQASIMDVWIRARIVEAELSVRWWSRSETDRVRRDVVPEPDLWAAIDRQRHEVGRVARYRRVLHAGDGDAQSSSVRSSRLPGPARVGRAPNQIGGAVRCSRVTDRLDRHPDFTAFAEECQLRMLRSAYLICGDRHLAEDLLQTAFVKVALRWGQLRDGQPEAYLRRILYRDAVSWWRKHRREIAVPSPPDGAARDEPVELKMVFAQALARLTPKQRAILVLRYFEDHTEARTAEVLGVAVGTVKSQTAVALRRLRELAPELSDLVRQQGEPR